MIRKGGELVEVEWDEAIAFVADGLRKAGSDIGALVAPMTSCEEGALLVELLRGLGSDRIDHRLRVQDFSDGGPAGQVFEMAAQDVAEIRAGLVIGSNLRHEMPLLNQRLRRATRHDASRPHIANMANYDIATIDGAHVFALNPVHFDWSFDLAGEKVVPPQDLVAALLGLAKAAGVAGGEPALAEAIAGAADDDEARQWCQALRDAGASVVILGDVATQHPQASWLRALARGIAKATDSAFNELPSGANAIGLARVGAQSSGGAKAILEHAPKALLTWQAGSQDTFAPAAYDKARENAGFHVYAGAYVCEGVKRTADAVLPIGLPPEIDGTYVNVDGAVQTVAAGSTLAGESRPGWKVLRAIGGALGVAGFDFTDFAGAHAGVADAVSKPVEAPNRTLAPATFPRAEGLYRVATVGIYRSDAVVRRAKALQAHPLNRAPALRICADDARTLGLLGGTRADVNGAVLPVVIDAAVPKGCAWIEAGHAATASLPPHGAALAIKAVAA
jgi:NADH-quinone oxidoreductase subunit G